MKRQGLCIPSDDKGRCDSTSWVIPDHCCPPYPVISSAMTAGIQGPFPKPLLSVISKETFLFSTNKQWLCLLNRRDLGVYLLFLFFPVLFLHWPEGWHTATEGQHSHPNSGCELNPVCSEISLFLCSTLPLSKQVHHGPVTPSRLCLLGCGSGHYFFVTELFWRILIARSIDFMSRIVCSIFMTF